MHENYIEAQCRNFEFSLTFTKNENKLSQIAYNDIQLEGKYSFLEQKNQKLIGTGRVRRILDASTLCGHRNRKHDQATV